MWTKKTSIPQQLPKSKLLCLQPPPLVYQKCLHMMISTYSVHQIFGKASLMGRRPLGSSPSGEVHQASWPPYTHPTLNFWQPSQAKLLGSPAVSRLHGKQWPVLLKQLLPTLRVAVLGLRPWPVQVSPLLALELCMQNHKNFHQVSQLLLVSGVGSGTAGQNVMFDS